MSWGVLGEQCIGGQVTSCCVCVCARFCLFVSTYVNTDSFRKPLQRLAPTVCTMAARMTMFAMLVLGVLVQLVAAGVGARYGLDTSLLAPDGASAFTPNSSTNPPSWILLLPAQSLGRIAAGVLSGLALVPFLLAAMIIFYVGVRNRAKPDGVNSKLPEAALWTTVVASLFCMVSNIATIVASAYGAINTGSIDPTPLELQTSAGLSIPTVVLSLVSVGLTIAALVKQ